jgi:acyl-ACP thioesterase
MATDSGFTMRAFEMVSPPLTGRVFGGHQRVRLGDVTPSGRMRLDGIARHLQDIAADDSRDSGLDGAEFWVVRRTTMAVRRFPVYQQALHVRTWCGGIGSHWAERRTRLDDAETGETLVDTATLWVKVDATTMRPARVGAQFIELYGDTAAGRRVSARLDHDDPDAGSPGQPWTLRFADFDALHHVNNAAGWEAVEEVLAARGRLRPRAGHPLCAEVEHREAIERGAQLSLVVDDQGDSGFAAWLVADAGSVALSAVVGCGQPAST